MTSPVVPATPTPMTPEQLARIRELPALIQQEKDLEKMIALASELADLLELELKERRKEREKNES